MASSTPRLIVSRTPLRVSFAGGGTDLPAFCGREPGAVFSTAITSYVWVTIKPHSELFFEPIRLNYSKSEEVQTIDEIENDIARECLKLLEIDPPIYISTVGDLPASSGLGGSSSFAVGLLNALHAYRGERVGPGQLAEEASHIEIDVLKQPIGKQDQYASAFGGLNYFSFRPDGSVLVEQKHVKDTTLQRLFASLLMFWTGHQRSAGSVLSEQQRNTGQKMDTLRKMRDHAQQLQALVSNGQLDVVDFGRVLDEGWSLKRDLATTISTNQIDRWYERAIEAGAVGGKLCGAGGGGFLLFVAEPDRHASVRQAMSDLMEVPIQHEVHGSQIIVPATGLT
jgi:D-glycero-alpha-D-manno-heptose-7-phosphate kinase